MCLAHSQECPLCLHISYVLISFCCILIHVVVGAVLRSSKGGEAGVLEDKEKASENIYVRRHEEEELKRLKEERV